MLIICLELDIIWNIDICHFYIRICDIQIKTYSSGSILYKNRTIPPIYQRLVPPWPITLSEIIGPAFFRLTHGPMAPYILISLETNISIDAARENLRFISAVTSKSFL
jgi:hypothetical protein